MNKRVYIVVAVASMMSNWNADFSKKPKQTSEGKIFGSSQALKYCIRNYCEHLGYKILMRKSMHFKSEKGKLELTPRSLEERYDYLFPENKIEDCKDSIEVLRNLFSITDVKQFGAVFAKKDHNYSITGAVQISEGFNKYSGTNVDEYSILSPYRNNSKENNKEDSDNVIKKNTTIGSRIVTDEAHYFYSIKINPLNYKEYVELGVTDGYTEEDYQIFKEASLVAATYTDSVAKVGCENEFGLFVETDPELNLPNLDQFIEFRKENGKNIIEITCDELINHFKAKNQIKNIEVYYNVDTTEVKFNVEDVHFYNIFTKEEV